MISAGDFRNGITIELDNNVYQIIEFQHVKPGKGAAFVRTKLKNIKSGGVVEKTFRPTEKCPQARIDRKDMQYLYEDGDLYYFMDTETYDQIALNSETVGDALKFVKENEMCKICSHNGAFSPWSPLCLWSLRLPKRSLALREIPLQALPSLQRWKPEQRFPCLFLWSRGTRSRLTPEQENTCPAYNLPHWIFLSLACETTGRRCQAFLLSFLT